MNKRLKRLVALTTISAMLVGCGKDTAEQAKEARESLKTDFSVNYDGIKTGTVDAGVSVHDPSIMEADGKYYVGGGIKGSSYLGLHDQSGYAYYIQRL